jgi:hypothetical protein
MPDPNRPHDDAMHSHNNNQKDNLGALYKVGCRERPDSIATSKDGSS